MVPGEVVVRVVVVTKVDLNQSHTHLHLTFQDRSMGPHNKHLTMANLTMVNLTMVNLAMVNLTMVNPTIPIMVVDIIAVKDLKGIKVTKAIKVTKVTKAIKVTKVAASSLFQFFFQHPEEELTGILMHEKTVIFFLIVFIGIS